MMGSWLQEHVWVCTYVVAGLAVVTFVLNFVFKRNRKVSRDKGGKEKSMGGMRSMGRKENVKGNVKKVKVKASRCENSTINQVGGDLTVNIKKGDG